LHLAVLANAVLGNNANSWVWWAWIPDHQHEIWNQGRRQL